MNNAIATNTTLAETLPPQNITILHGIQWDTYQKQ